MCFIGSLFVKILSCKVTLFRKLNKSWLPCTQQQDTHTLQLVVQFKQVKGGRTGPAGPVLAGPLFQRVSKTFELTKKQMHGKQLLILATRT